MSQEGVLFYPTVGDVIFSTFLMSTCFSVLVGYWCLVNSLAQSLVEKGRRSETLPHSPGQGGYDNRVVCKSCEDRVKVGIKSFETKVKASKSAKRFQSYRHLKVEYILWVIYQ